MPTSNHNTRRVELLAEAFAIADGKSMKMGTTEHVEALVHYVRQLATELHEAIDVCLHGGQETDEHD